MSLTSALPPISSALLIPAIRMHTQCTINDFLTGRAWEKWGGVFAPSAFPTSWWYSCLQSGMFLLWGDHRSCWRKGLPISLHPQSLPFIQTVLRLFSRLIRAMWGECCEEHNHKMIHTHLYDAHSLSINPSEPGGPQEPMLGPRRLQWKYGELEEQEDFVEMKTTGQNCMIFFKKSCLLNILLKMATRTLIWSNMNKVEWGWIVVE
jgi:hypothetical protein